jgi:hypothetical protein
MSDQCQSGSDDGAKFKKGSPVQSTCIPIISEANLESCKTAANAQHQVQSTTSAEKQRRVKRSIVKYVLILGLVAFLPFLPTILKDTHTSFRSLSVDGREFVYDPETELFVFEKDLAGDSFEDRDDPTSSNQHDGGEL